MPDGIKFFHLLLIKEQIARLWTWGSLWLFIHFMILRLQSFIFFSHLRIAICLGHHHFLIKFDNYCHLFYMVQWFLDILTTNIMICLKADLCAFGMVLTVIDETDRTIPCFHCFRYSFFIDRVSYLNGNR